MSTKEMSVRERAMETWNKAKANPETKNWAPETWKSMRSVLQKWVALEEPAEMDRFEEQNRMEASNPLEP